MGQELIAARHALMPGELAGGIEKSRRLPEQPPV